MAKPTILGTNTIVYDGSGLGTPGTGQIFIYSSQVPG